MTREQLASKLADELGVSKREALAILKAVLTSLAEALETEQRLTLKGFGTFAVRERRQKPARNPKTGQPLLVPGYRTVIFRPGETLKRRLGSFSKGAPGP